jgi:hypothetical protein
MTLLPSLGWGLLFIAFATGPCGMASQSFITVACAGQDSNCRPQGQVEEQPEPGRLDWVDWSNKFAERGRTEKERALRRYIVKLEGVIQMEAISYTAEREERLFAERANAIPIILELLEAVLPMASKRLVTDGLNWSIPVQDLERLARRDRAAFTAPHLGMIHRLIKENGLYYGDQTLLPLVAILRRKESIPHVAALLEQPDRGHLQAIAALQEIAHPDGLPYLRTYAERNPAKAHWANPAIERIEIDNLPMSERVQKWQAIVSELASEEAFQPERIRATQDQARWVLSRLSEYGEWRHAEIVLKLQAAARQAGDNSVQMRAEKAYQGLAEKLPLRERLAIWEKILKEVSAEKMAQDETALYRAVWAAQKLEKEGGSKYLSLFEEMTRREGLFDAASMLEKAVQEAITRLKQDRR